MKMIGRYIIRGLLGRGGMSTVYKVAMPTTGKIVALKLLAPSVHLLDLVGEEKMRQLFTTEAVTMARLRNPHIAEVWDFDEDQGQPFFIMEYYCNNLGKVIGEQQEAEKPSRLLSPDKVFHYGLQILDGLACLHDAGITHRDIKPYNILLTDQDTVKIADFGMSKLHGEPFPSPGTMNIGSPYYAAPEQAQDPEGVDGRADLYSLTVMLLRMLTGELPEKGLTAKSLEASALGEIGVPFFRQGLHEHPANRFADAVAMQRSLTELRKKWQARKEQTCSLIPDGKQKRPATAYRSPVTLRNTPIKANPTDGRRLFPVDALWRPTVHVANQFDLSHPATIADQATGLVWQQSGSRYPLTWEGAQEYVATLNNQSFSGRTDWRIPTVEELLSLLSEKNDMGSYCQEPLFDSLQSGLWSIDRRSSIAAWYVNMDMGFIGWQDTTCFFFIRAVASPP